MTTRAYLLQPTDVWFFRDGRPYDRYEASQTAVKSLFPPSPLTVLGALRAGLARALGWRDGPWPAEICAVLGDGIEDLAELSLRGPYLARSVDPERPEPWWPLPVHLVGIVQNGVRHAQALGHREDEQSLPWRARALLRPSQEPIRCDLGEVHLPVPSSDKPAPPSERLSARPRYWVNTAGLDAILAGRLPKPEDVIAPPWQHQMRVGIHRDETTRTTSDRAHALYSPLMVSLRPDFGLLAEMRGVPDTVDDPAPVLPLGGESRLAACQRVASPRAPSCPSNLIRKSRRCVVVHLSPARLSSLPRPGETLPDLPGARVVTACLRPLEQIGGWDGRDRAKARPRPLNPVVAAGSVWFCELDGDVDATLNMHDGRIGDDTRCGFGHLALGTWPA
ncbi:CRISPR-associated protein, Cmr3 [Haliangium ochraceum]|uniref:CRISPR-associated protein, Cmr3 n=1 Tax=Haliangium ochraceum (strain DSM 14365 / JCM 11303 / SMP-2) TaxID=502025 RepID=D0LTH9_HALO1|nr:CRISPR-associated protein, Cmr3 [Haliangium ochraceum]ACY13874.1 CRISPR-associated protein, Cmr3 [Haliangium ochraceum DSM 14365]